MHLSIPAGTTSKIISFPVYDSSSTVGVTLPGLVYNTASLTAYYNRTGSTGSSVAIPLVTMTKGIWANCGLVSVDNTNMPGWYELGIPDAAIAAGCQQLQIMIRGAANMVPVCIEIELTATSNQDAVRGGMSEIATIATGIVEIKSYTSDQRTGAQPVNITIKTSPGAPIPGVIVDIYNSDMSIMVAKCVTDTLGVAKLQNTSYTPYLDNGSYKAVCSKLGTTIPNPTSFTVNNVQADVPIVGAVTVPPTPGSNLCSIYGYAKRLDESIAPGALIIAKLALKSFVKNSTAFSHKEVRATSDLNGRFTISVERNAQIDLQIRDGQESCLSFDGVVPNTSSVDIEVLVNG